MASTREPDDERFERFVLLIPMKTASNLLISTIAKNIMKIITSLETFKDPKACQNPDSLNQFFKFPIKYLDTMKKSTILYLVKPRPFVDFFNKIKELTFKSKHLEKTAEIIYPMFERSLKNALLAKGSISQTINYPQIIPERLCENCNIEISGGKLKTRNGVLDYDDEEDEELWLDYLGQHLKYVKEMCSCKV